jgi:hypothetical protein
MPGDNGKQNVSPCTLKTGQRHTVVVPRYQGRLFWMADVPIVRTEIKLLDPDGVTLATTETDDSGDFSFELGFPTGCQVVRKTVEPNETTLFARLFLHDVHTPLGDTEVQFTEFGELRVARTNNEGELRVEGLTDHFYRLQVAGVTVSVTTLTADEMAAGREPEKVVISSQLGALGAESEEDGEFLGDPEEDLNPDSDASPDGASSEGAAEL